MQSNCQCQLERLPEECFMYNRLILLATILLSKTYQRDKLNKKIMLASYAKLIISQLGRQE